MSDTKGTHLAKGHRLQDGKYRIEKKIGQGGFGITYLARWYMQITGAMGEANSYAAVVIKEFYWGEYCHRENDGKTVSISSATGKDLFSKFKEKLKKEGRLLSKFQHPNIVRILDIFEENHTAYLVMQYIEGSSLKEIITKEGQLSEEKALKYVDQLCSALIEVHNEKILHLDIKPTNVLIDEDDNAQLIDFGVSKQYSSDTTGALSETPFGVSRGYSPIEQYSGINKFSPPADIYALGATLYYMLAGKTPLESTLRNLEDIEPIAHVNPWVNSIIEKAMEIRPKDRFQSMEEFRKALSGNDSAGTITKKEEKEKTGEVEETIIEETEIETLPKRKERDKPEPIRSEKPNKANELKVWIGIGVALVVIVVCAVFLLQSPAKISEKTTPNQQVVQPTDRLRTEQPTVSQPENTWVAEYDQNLKNGNSSFNQGKYTSAKSAYQKALSAIPVSDTSDKKSTINQKISACNTQIKKAEDEKKKAETAQKETDNRQAIATNLTKANQAFARKRFAEALQLYLKVKSLGGETSTGYNNFLSLAKSLAINTGYDANVKTMLLNAQKLSNTQEVRGLLEKCK